MKSMSRKELAFRAGVTTKTLYNQTKRHLDELWALGYRPNEILPPRVVECYAKNYGVDISDRETT
jgi:DNA-binding XRE family transcriptional regulator